MSQKPTDRKSIAEIFHHVLGQALVAVTGAEEEAAKLFKSRVQDAAGWSQDEVRRQVPASSAIAWLASAGSWKGGWKPP